VIGGLELISYNLACGLAELGHKTVLFATNGSKVPPKGFLVEFGEPKGRVHCDWLEAERDAFNKYKHMLRDFDIILGSNWFGMEYAFKASNPTFKVAHVHHGDLSMKYWGRTKPPFKLNLIAISKWMQQGYASQGFVSRVCYNGINLADYPMAKKRKRTNWLLWIGRIDRFKQPDFAIRVAEKAKLPLTIVGGTFVQDPAYLSRIKSMCDGKRIRFIPDAPHDVKLRLLQTCKAVLFTSKMGEPFGLVPVEANACGACVLSTVDGATPETVRDGETGFLCGNEEEMAENLKHIDLVSAKKCRMWVEDKFSHIAMTKQYLARFNEILSGDEW
jgi:glycosyltransferase involved in cell wall biosynthesis